MSRTFQKIALGLESSLIDSYRLIFQLLKKYASKELFMIIN